MRIPGIHGMQNIEYSEKACRKSGRSCVSQAFAACKMQNMAKKHAGGQADHAYPRHSRHAKYRIWQKSMPEVRQIMRIPGHHGMQNAEYSEKACR